MQAVMCPICSGTGKVRQGFYPDDPDRTVCRACSNGVIVVQDQPSSVDYSQLEQHLKQLSGREYYKHERGDLAVNRQWYG